MALPKVLYCLFSALLTFPLFTQSTRLARHLLPMMLRPVSMSSQVNFRLMAEYNISVSRLTELHSRFTSNKVLECRLKNAKIKVKQWSFIAYADVLATDEDC